MKNFRMLIAILIMGIASYAPPASAQSVERIARIAGIVPAGCWGGTIEKVICAANRRSHSGRIGSSQRRATPTDARAAFVRIAEWHEINAVMQTDCVPGQSRRCGLQGELGSMVTLEAARQLMTLCYNGNSFACDTLVRKAPSDRR